MISAAENNDYNLQLPLAGLERVVRLMRLIGIVSQQQLVSLASE